MSLATRIFNENAPDERDPELKDRTIEAWDSHNNDTSAKADRLHRVHAKAKLEVSKHMPKGFWYDDYDKNSPRAGRTSDLGDYQTARKNLKWSKEQPSIFPERQPSSKYRNPVDVKRPYYVALAAKQKAKADGDTAVEKLPLFWGKPKSSGHETQRFSQAKAWAERASESPEKKPKTLKVGRASNLQYDDQDRNTGGGRQIIKKHLPTTESIAALTNSITEARAKLGSGARFKSLENKLVKKGAKSPSALSAWIGRQKFGKAKFSQLSARGKHSYTESSDESVAKLNALSESLIDLRKSIVGK